MRNLRIYPLRMTKKNWRIPIHVRHECSAEQCGRAFVRDESKGRYVFVLRDNPEYKNGKCPFHNKIERGAMKPAYFEQGNPHGVRGPLHNPDEVVVPDREIEVQIDYPLINSVTISIDFGHSNITRAELLYAVSCAYRHIYEVEERTSPAVSYTIVQECNSCMGKNVHDWVISFKPKKKKEECAICFQNYYGKKAVKLPCEHVFHDECIKKWLDGEDNNSCPLCRGPVLRCSQCDGKRCTYEQHESVVIPVEHRGGILNRNPTFGVFGIYGHDLEDLCLYDMKYFREEKKLYLEIDS